MATSTRQVPQRKSEIRNPKFETNPKFENGNPNFAFAATDETRTEHGIESVFNPCFIRGSLSFGFPISDFGFRAWKLPCGLSKYRNPIRPNRIKGVICPISSTRIVGKKQSAMNQEIAR